MRDTHTSCRHVGVVYIGVCVCVCATKQLSFYVCLFQGVGPYVSGRDTHTLCCHMSVVYIGVCVCVCATKEPCFCWYVCLFQGVNLDIMCVCLLQIYISVRYICKRHTHIMPSCGCGLYRCVCVRVCHNRALLLLMLVSFRVWSLDIMRVCVSLTDIGLFCEFIGLFCGYVGLFCAYVGLFQGVEPSHNECVSLKDIGLFCAYTGLFC